MVNCFFKTINAHFLNKLTLNPQRAGERERNKKDRQIDREREGWGQRRGESNRQMHYFVISINQKNIHYFFLLQRFYIFKVSRLSTFISLVFHVVFPCINCFFLSKQSFVATLLIKIVSKLLVYTRFRNYLLLQTMPE